MWQSSASISTLHKRAQVFHVLRRFFHERHVLEVDVPVLGRATVSDPHLDSLALNINDTAYYLQTSPEYFLKRLLACDSPDIYYLGKAFRYDEVGKRHNPEFTMLEWYRKGFNDQELIEELISLILSIEPDIAVTQRSYEDIFSCATGINPHSCSAHELKRFAHQHLHVDWSDEGKNIWLDLIFSHVIEPKMSSGLTVVYDYPKEQAALAKLAYNDNGMQIAKRFEVFINAIELANGYWELTDANEQKRRFEQDNITRQSLGKPQVPLDANFLASMDHGLPECAGVALGVDRLLMALFDCPSIEDVQAFSFNTL